jgi:Tol biopolymer transport system component
VLPRLSAHVDIYVVGADGSSAHAITHDGRSLYPVWGPTRIAYTHERLRRADAPVYQLRVMRPDGSGVRRLTHLRIPRLLSGLTATAWSADGSRLLAEYGGQDTSEAWTVDVPSGRAHDLTGRFDGVIGVDLSADGRTVLVQRGYFDDPKRQSVATIPFRGGRSTVLVRHGSAPSWGG